MANPRSNIFPIQLQNAELNLNKFDAEIKPYAGFNKNNAPFIGGCLSNIFTKDVNNEGSNDSNTFIDDEENVYIASKTDLKKNGNVVLEYGNQVFFQNNKLEFDKDAKVKKVLSNDYYIDESVLSFGNYRVFKFCKRTGTFNDAGHAKRVVILATEEPSENVAESIIKNNMTSICVNRGGVCYFVFTCVWDNIIQFLIVNESTKDYFMKNFELPFGSSNKIENEPINICYDDVNNHLSVFYSATSGDYLRAVNFFSVQWTQGNITRVTPQNSVITSISGDMETSGVKLAGSDLSNYIISNYPYNTATLSRIPVSQVTSSEAFNVLIKMAVPYTLDGTQLLFRNSFPSYYPTMKTVLANNLGLRQLDNLDLGTITSLINCYDYQAVVTEEQNSTDYKSMCIHFKPGDFYSIPSCTGFQFTDKESSVNNVGTFSKAKHVLGDFVKLGNNFYLAMNNNQLSAICGKNVLLTEWNAIDASTVSYYINNANRINEQYDERITYKCGNDWYEIRLVENPEIRIFDKQIVVNVDSMKNSYDIKRQKVLHFAVPYNSLNDEKGINYVTTDFYDFKDIKNNCYVAGAVNEYEQENNSSIILNPISIFVMDLDSYKRFNIGVPPFTPNISDIVNIYANFEGSTGNADAVSIKYQYSIFKDNNGNYKAKYSDKLIDLTYPLDTNGNVEYNVNLFSKIKSIFGNIAVITSQLNSYPLAIGNNNNILMSYYLGSGIENMSELFIIQGQHFGIMGNWIYSLYYSEGVVSNVQAVCSVEGLQFCGCTPYEALFFSKVNRTLYSFIGSNVLQVRQMIDKVSVIKAYVYNAQTQSMILLTNIGVLFSSLFGAYALDYPDTESIFIVNKGIVLSDNGGNYKYIKYYKEADDDYTKQNIKLDTCFYGVNNQTVSINDCLYLRIFNTEHEEGELIVSASTISNEGRKTEKTIFKIKASDWDKLTHTIYLRYQPKEQRGLGVSFSIDSPFNISAIGIGSQTDAILIDKVSKKAINNPQITSNNVEW